MSGWTLAEVDDLKRLAGQGLTASQIAARLGTGRSRNAVIGKLERINVPLLAYARGAAGSRPATKSRATGARKLPSRAGRTGTAKPPVAVPVVTKPAIDASAPVVHLPATLPMTFLDAMFAGRCLHFVGHPYGPDGPAMPVCGAERAFDKTERQRFCIRHHQSSHRWGEE